MPLDQTTALAGAADRDGPLGIVDLVARGAYGRRPGPDGDVVVVQVRSAAGTTPSQRATLRALGLRGIGRARVHRGHDPVFLGMARAVRHLVEVKALAEAEDGSAAGRSLEPMERVRPNQEDKMSSTVYAFTPTRPERPDGAGEVLRFATTDHGPNYLQIERSGPRTVLAWTTDLPLRSCWRRLESRGLVPGMGSRAVVLVAGREHETVTVAQALDAARAGAPIRFLRADGDGLTVTWRDAVAPRDGAPPRADRERRQLVLSSAQPDPARWADAVKATATPIVRNRALALVPGLVAGGTSRG